MEQLDTQVQALEISEEKKGVKEGYTPNPLTETQYILSFYLLMQGFSQEVSGFSNEHNGYVGIILGSLVGMGVLLWVLKSEVFPIIDYFIARMRLEEELDLLIYEARKKERNNKRT